jgi:hypothetical protein
MQHESEAKEQSGWRGWLLMAACCIPMIAIIILVALGYWGFG